MKSRSEEFLIKKKNKNRDYHNDSPCLQRQYIKIVPVFKDNI